MKKKKARFSIPANWPKIEQVEKPTPVDPAKMSQAEKWLRSVPKIPRGAVKIPIELELDQTSWFFLCEAAASNGWTLEETIAYMVEDHDNGVAEWSNDDFKPRGVGYDECDDPKGEDEGGVEGDERKGSPA